MGVYHEEGLYRTIVQSAAVVTAKSGNPQLQLEIQVVGKYDQGEDSHLDMSCPRGRWNPSIYLSITDNTMGTPNDPGWVAETLRFLQFDGDFNNVSQFEGMHVNAYCQHRQDLHGNDQEQWNVDRPRDRKVNAVQSKFARYLKSRYGKMFKTTDKKESEEKEEQNVQNEPTTPEQQDIPF